MKNKGRRNIALILLALLITGLHSSCGGNPKTSSSAEAENPNKTTRVIADMTGRMVAIPAPEHIKRVAVQTSPQVLNAYAIGISEKLCAVTNSVKRWKLLAKADPRLKDVPATRAGNAQINIEALLQTNPDICIGSESDMQAIEKSTKLPTLRISLGIPGAYFKSIRQEVAFFGRIFGREERVKTFNNYLDHALQRIQANTEDLATKKPKIYMGFDVDHLTTYGGDTFMDQWIEAAGCINAAHTIKTLGGKEGGLARISMEQLLGWDPDIVVIDAGQPGDLFNDPVWPNLNAVKNNRVFRLPMGIFLWNRPSCEAAVLFPEWLAVKAYPGSFKNIDFIKHTKNFYRDVFGFDFADDDINQILNP
jgi:iron complex transport system substrate-binding protein